LGRITKMHSNNEQIQQAMKDEASLIGGIILDASTIYSAIEHVTAKDFVSDGYGLVFATIKAMLDRGIPANNKVITGELIKAGAHKAIGGDLEFAKLTFEAMPHHATYYAEQVARWSRIRRLKAVAVDLASDLDELNADPQAIAERAQEAILEASSIRFDDVKKIAEVCTQELERLEDMRTRGVSGVLSTGLPCIDRAIGGGLGVGVTILAARPNIGKSALAMEIGTRIADRGEPVLFVSLEMTSAQNAHRFMSRDTGISIEAIQAASYSEHDVPRMMKAISDNHERPFYVWQAPGSSAIQIESKLRVMKAKFGIRLAIVDYLGLVQGDSKASVYERTTSNSQAFATMAKRLDLPILVLCQLNRLAEGEVPELHHLRDSGSIEQDADVVAFIHRDKRDSQEALFIAAKKRQGAIAQTYLNFQDGRFSDPNEAYTADFAKVVA